MAKKLWTLAALFSLWSSAAFGELDEQPLGPNDNWPLPDLFRAGEYSEAVELRIRKKTSTGFSENEVKTECKALSIIERKNLGAAFYFGLALGGDPPRCLLDRLEVKIDGVSQSIPREVVTLFSEAPLADSIRVSGGTRIAIVTFLGGSGAGRYEARLTFRNNRLSKRQVYGFDPKIEKFRLFVDKYD